MDKSEVLKKWNCGELGFWQWVKDFEPRVLNNDKRYEIWKATSLQTDFIKGALADGVQMSITICPRRHGKSIANVMLVLWLFTSRENFTCQLLGSGESHGRRVMLNLLKRTIQNTVKLNRMIPIEDHLTWEIRLPALGNIIQLSSALASNAFGDSLSCLWISDLHAHINNEAFQAYQASLMDSKGSIVLIDANIDSIGGAAYQIQEESKTNSKVFCQYVNYKNFEDYSLMAPAWIDRDRAKSILDSNPLTGARDILGIRGDAEQALFSTELIQGAWINHAISDIKAFVNGRKYCIGAGLDRSKKLVALGSRSDKTIWSVVLKCANLDGTSEYYLLKQTELKINSDKNLKAMILQDYKTYAFQVSILEDYGISDELRNWLSSQKIPFEVVSPSDNLQNKAFPEMYKIFHEGRFHYNAALNTELTKELSTFNIYERAGGKYSFGHSSKKFHDDRVYSLCWALFGLGNIALSIFELSVCCEARTNKHGGGKCFMLGGFTLPSCSAKCGSYADLKLMYKNYKQISTEDSLSILEFYDAYVTIRSRLSFNR